jgi:hypothetical protein
MGWDVTYHPIGRDDIKNIYFKTLAEPSYARKVATDFGLSDEDYDRMCHMFDIGRSFDKAEQFNKTHAFCIAIIAGFLRNYHYIRGGAFSFLASEDKAFERYITSWRELVPEDYNDCIFDDMLTENYCGGVYIRHENLVRIKQDYQTDLHIKQRLDQIFSHERLDIFWQAVDSAIAQDLDLIEATEVVTPHPIQLEQTECYSKLTNCDRAGIVLYAMAVMQQMAELQASTDDSAPSAASTPEQSDQPDSSSSAEQASTTSSDSWLGRLFARWFGR